MEKVSITELREHLSAYIARVSKGREFEIVSGGRVVARLVPAADSKTQARKALESLQAESRVGDVVTPLGKRWNAARGGTRRLLECGSATR